MYKFTGFISLFFSIVSFSQSFSSFNNTAFITDFPQNTIQALYQDAKDYIWIGTESGLNMYDGQRVYNYKAGRNDNFFLTGKGINNIVADYTGRIWVATSSGLAIFHPEKSYADNVINDSLARRINKQVPDHHAECIRVLKNKNVVIGFDKSFVMYDPATDKTIILPRLKFDNETFTDFYLAIQEDEQGNIILASEKEGIFILDKGLHVIKHFLKDQFLTTKPGVLRNIVYVGNNSLWIGATSGLFFLDISTGASRTIEMTVPTGLSKSEQVNCFAYNPERKIILAGTNTNGFLVLDLNGNIIEHIYDDKETVRLHSNNIYFLLAGNQNLGWWIGTGQGLVRMFYKENLFSRKVLANADNSPARTYPIFTGDNQNILIGTNTHLVSLNLKTNIEKKYFIPGNEPRRFNYILPLAPDFYVFCTKSGIYYSTDQKYPVLKKISDIYPELKPTDSIHILCAAVSGDKVLFGLRNRGLTIWDRKKKTLQNFGSAENDPKSLPDNTINNIRPSRLGKFYLCTSNGLCVFDLNNSTFERLLMPGVDGLNYSQVNDVQEQDGVLWIGTYGGGLNRYDQTKKSISYITEREGLPNNDVYAIHKTDDGNLWISTNKGLAVLDPRTNKIRAYDKSNGLLDNEFNRTSSFQRGDTLYFGGLSGICWFNYKQITSSGIAPIVDISRMLQVTSNGEKIIFPDEKGRIYASYRQSSFRFQLASPFYINPEKTRFYFRILPRQKEWISNGTSNELIIPQLSPGHHTLEVKSISSEGVESRNIKTIPIRIYPPWYGSWWFRVLLLSVIAGILFTFYKMRINQLKKEEKIRYNLASDLHDDLGSTLNSVKVYSNLALMEKENAVHLNKIKEGAQEAIAGVRDLIWILDDKKDTVQNLLERINQFAVNLCEVNKIQFSQSVDDGLHSLILGKEEKRNLYLIIKESINNSIKYAQCTKIDLTISNAGDRLAITISDDGNGFDLKTAREGHGLKNMVVRAKTIGYSNTIASNPGIGTTIKLQKL